MTDGGATVSMLGRASVQRPCFIVQIDKKGQEFRSFSGKKRKIAQSKWKSERNF